MTAHNNIHEPPTLAAAAGFDELFSTPTTMKAAHAAGRCESVPYDEHRSDMPAVTPVSPCQSEMDASTVSSAPSITGRFSNIEHKYRVDPRVLGSGHHGSVRVCFDRSTGERYAVKSVRKTDPAVKPGGLAREIALLREMRHGRIVRLVDVCEDAEYLHLVTDLCEGGELFDRIVRKSSEDNGATCFAERDAARIVRQILSAVRYMAEHNVVHRDLKPENVLFETKDEDSAIRIIDFGLARKHFGDMEPPMTTIVGTPYYIPPEVLAKRYDGACDLWSVGVIAYTMLAGYPPFNGADNAQVYDAIRRGRYRFHSAEWASTSREARDFVRRLLRRDPRERMTVGEALEHPWLVRHCDGAAMEEERQDIDTSVEIVYHGLPRRDSIICVGEMETRDIMMPTLLSDI